MLSVLYVAYPFAPVGPDAVGGAEQVLHALDDYLTRNGHRSVVIAREGSKTSGMLVPVPRVHGTLDAAKRRIVHETCAAAVQQALERWRFDVVHMHGVDFYDYLPMRGVPVLATLHLPPANYPPGVFRLERPDTHVHCVSASQRRSCPEDASLLPDVENGVPVHRFRPRWDKGRYVVALGRICPEKGHHLALDAARRCDIPLVLAGEVFPYAEHQEYFQKEIVPRLDARRRFIGPVGLRRKARLLAGAQCLLVPSLVEETSSLVVMEAMACATPVVAFPSGALKELVQHGQTGFLVQNEREMAEAITATPMLDPLDCRRAAETRFSCERMCTAYLDIYQQLCRPRRWLNQLVAQWM